MLKKTFLFISLLVSLTSNAIFADFPNRDIRVIVPSAAGGGTDAIVRKISNIAEEALSVSMYVSNIEGGMTATGLLQLMKARPDGLTIASINYDSIITIPWLNMMPNFKIDRMRVIARISTEADAIIVPKESPYRNIDELITAAKNKPRSIKVGIQNMGARTHLTLLQMQQMTDTEFKIVAYENSAASQKEALLNGEVDAVVTSLGDLAPLLESGQARGLVEFSDVQNSGFPNVPPITKSKNNLDLAMGSFIILVAPAGTPDDVIYMLESVYHDAYMSDEFQLWLTKIGVTPAWLGSDDAAKWAKSNQKRLFDTMDSMAEQGLLNK